MSTIGPKIILEGEKEYRKAVSDVNSAMRVLKSEMRAVTAEFDGNANSIEALRKKNENLVKQQAEQEKSVKLLRGALESVTKEFGENSRQANQWHTRLNNSQAQLTKLNRQLSENEKHLKEAERATDQTARSIDEYGKHIEDASEKTSVFGDVLKASLASEAIVSAIKATTATIRDLSKESLDVGMNFEASMSQVAATMGMTRQEIEGGSEVFRALSVAAKEAGESTIFTATQAAEALNYLALAGYDADRAIATLPAVLDLAVAGGLDLGYATNLVTDGAAALEIGIEGLNEYVDKLARTSQKANTNVAQLGEATLKVAGTASSAGMDLDTLNASLGVLANNGIKGAEAGTRLRNIILSLTSPTDTTAKKFTELGVQVANTDGSIRNINDIMEDFNTKLSVMTDSDRINVISTIFNKTDITAVNALLKSTTEEFANLREEITQSDGAAKNMADTMQANLKGQIEELRSVAETVGITIYEKFNESFSNMADAGIEGLGKLNEELEKGELGDNINKLADSLENATEKGVEFAIDVLPGVIDGLSWILDNSNKITAGLKGIGTAILTKKAGEGILHAVNAYKALTTATETATVAQAIFNDVSKANVYVAIASAVIGLGTALISYAKSAREASDETDVLSEKTRNLVDESKKLREETEKQSQAWQESTRDIEEQYGALELLSEKLYDLAEKENKSNSEKQQMVALVDQLNQKLPELNLQISEQTGELNLQEEQVFSLIAAQKEYYLIQAAQDGYSDIARQRVEAEMNINELQEQQKIKVAQLLELRRQLVSLGGTEGVEAHAFEEQKDAIDKTNDSIKRLKLEIGAISSELFGWNQQLSESTKAWEMTEKYIEKFSKTLDGAGDSVDEFGRKYRQTLEDQGMLELGTLEDRQNQISKIYDEASKELEKKIKADEKAFTKSQQRRTEAVNEAQQKELQSVEKTHARKLALINEEYLEKMKIVDEERYNELMAIQKELDDIDSQTEAEERAIKARENAEKRAELKLRVESSKTAEERLDAQRELAKFEERVARDRLSTERKLQKDVLNSQKDAINEKYNAQIKALEEEQKKEQENSNNVLKLEKDNINKRFKLKKEALKDELDIERDSLREKQSKYRDYLKEQRELAQKNAKQIYEDDLAQHKINQALKYDAAMSSEREMKKAIQEYAYKNLAPGRERDAILRTNDLNEMLKYYNPSALIKTPTASTSSASNIDYNLMSDVMKSALKTVRIELNGKNVGSFVENTVNNMVRR